LSLDVFGPHRITGTAKASGERCEHCSQKTHTHGVARCRSPSVVLAAVFAGIGLAYFSGQPFKTAVFAKDSVKVWIAHRARS